MDKCFEREREAEHVPEQESRLEMQQQQPVTNISGQKNGADIIFQLNSAKKILLTA